VQDLTESVDNTRGHVHARPHATRDVLIASRAPEAREGSNVHGDGVANRELGKLAADEPRNHQVTQEG
jgi:hypothetical protein